MREAATACEALCRDGRDSVFDNRESTYDRENLFCTLCGLSLLPYLGRADNHLMPTTDRYGAGSSMRYER